MTPNDTAFTDTLISRSVRERIVLVGVTFPHTKVAETEAGLDELALLVDTAGADVEERVLQRRSTPDPATYLGRGKAEELLSVCLAVDADTVVFDDDLSPAQQRNLERILGGPPSIARRSSSTSSPRTPRPPKAAPRSSWLCFGIGCPACVGAGGHSASRPAASAPGVRARPSSRSTGDGWCGG